MENLIASGNSTGNSRGALHIALIYAVVAALWVLFSDELLDMLVSDHKLLTRIALFKGWLFVLVTAILLHWLISRYHRVIDREENRLREVIQRVSAATGEAFFALLVQNLAELLGADYALVGELDRDDPPKVRTIAVFGKGNTQENFEYELVGSPCADVVSNSGQECYFASGVSREFPEDTLLRTMDADGYICTPLRDSVGRTMGLMAVVSCRPLEKRELAESLFRLFAVRATAELERRQAEVALKTQFDQMSTIFDSLNALVYVADLETNELIYMNKFGAGLFSADWQGKKCYDVLQAAKTGPCEYCTNDHLVKDGIPEPDVIWEFQNSLTGRWFQCIDRAINWTDGRLVRLEIAIDISERKEMEQMKDEIISSISHEMRTPLTAMMGFTEFLLENKVEPEEQRTYLATIHKETRRLNELISNFLDLQQLKAKQVTYHFTAVRVLPLIEDAVAIFTFDQDQHRIIIDCPATLPPVRGDEARLHQVLTNLISNAIKYSPPGSLVTVGASSEGKDVTIQVRDEGHGIPLELQKRIFDRFYRLDNSDRRQVGGTGIGLSLVQELVAAHRGTIRVESSGERGSTFSVSLPVMVESQGKGVQGPVRRTN